MVTTEQPQADRKLIAACGLYCGACGKFLKGKCPGCAQTQKAGWCKVRTCCGEHGYTSCAECTEFADPRRCSRFVNFIAKIVGVVLNSDRAQCIARLRAVGPEQFAREMADCRRQALPRT